MEISAEQMALIKTHLRVDSDAEDSLISAYTSAAVDYVEKFCDGALVASLTPPVEGEIVSSTDGCNTLIEPLCG